MATSSTPKKNTPQTTAAERKALSDRAKAIVGGASPSSIPQSSGGGGGSSNSQQKSTPSPSRSELPQQKQEQLTNLDKALNEKQISQKSYSSLVKNIVNEEKNNQDVQAARQRKIDSDSASKQIQDSNVKPVAKDILRVQRSLPEKFQTPETQKAIAQYSVDRTIASQPSTREMIKGAIGQDVGKPSNIRSTDTLRSEQRQSLVEEVERERKNVDIIGAIAGRVQNQTDRGLVDTSSKVINRVTDEGVNYGKDVARKTFIEKDPVAAINAALLLTPTGLGRGVALKAGSKIIRNERVINVAEQLIGKSRQGARTILDKAAPTSVNLEKLFPGGGLLGVGAIGRARANSPKITGVALTTIGLVAGPSTALKIDTALSSKEDRKQKESEQFKQLLGTERQRQTQETLQQASKYGVIGTFIGGGMESISPLSFLTTTPSESRQGFRQAGINAGLSGDELDRFVKNAQRQRVVGEGSEAPFLILGLNAASNRLGANLITEIFKKGGTSTPTKAALTTIPAFVFGGALEGAGIETGQQMSRFDQRPFVDDNTFTKGNLNPLEMSSSRLGAIFKAGTFGAATAPIIGVPIIGASLSKSSKVQKFGSFLDTTAKITDPGEKPGDIADDLLRNLQVKRFKQEIEVPSVAKSKLKDSNEIMLGAKTLRRVRTSTPQSSVSFDIGEAQQVNVFERGGNFEFSPNIQPNTNQPINNNVNFDPISNTETFTNTNIDLFTPPEQIPPNENIFTAQQNNQYLNNPTTGLPALFPPFMPNIPVSGEGSAKGLKGKKYINEFALATGLLSTILYNDPIKPQSYSGTRKGAAKKLKQGALVFDFGDTFNNLNPYKIQRPKKKGKKKR